VARASHLRDDLLRRSRYRRHGDRSQYPELVRRAGKAKLEPAELDLRPRVVGAVSEHGGGGLVGLAARGMGRCGKTADRLRDSNPPERPVVVPVLWAAPPRTRLRGGLGAVGADPRDDGPLLAAVETGWGALRSVPGLGHVRKRLELCRLAAERIAPCCSSLSRKVVDDRCKCEAKVS
jgi:hypothetical protein